MCFASSAVSGPGETPDLEDSEEVLIWMWMLTGVGAGGEREARPRLRAVAFFGVSTLEIRWREGTVEVSGLHLSRGGERLVVVRGREGKGDVCVLGGGRGRGNGEGMKYSDSNAGELNGLDDGAIELKLCVVVAKFFLGLGR